MKGDRKGFSGNVWLQHPQEIDPFIELLVREGVRSYLEVGCFCGDTFHAVGCALPGGSRMVAIDHVVAMKTFPRRQEVIRQSIARCLDDLRARGQDARFVQGNSRDTAVIEAARGEYDCVFIDGDHSLVGVTHDWNNYGPMGRIVAFHDIVGDHIASIGPRPLWAELKQQYRHVEFIHTGTERGIGVLWRT